MSRSKEAWADDPFIGDPTDAAKVLHEWEERLRVEREGRDLPPEDGDGDPACPNCGATTGFHHHYGEMMECHACGAKVTESELAR